jgi:hypothetical protein
MSDNLKRYLAILHALKQLCPTEPQDNYLRRLHTRSPSGCARLWSVHISSKRYVGKPPAENRRLCFARPPKASADLPACSRYGFLPLRQTFSVVRSHTEE